MKIRCNLFVVLLLTAAVFAATAEAQKKGGEISGRIEKKENQDLGERVRLDFEATRKGTYLSGQHLENEGAAIIPYLKPYQNDADPNVRSQVIWYLGKIIVQDSIPLLARALSDNDKNVSAGAARTLYQFYQPAMFQNDSETGANLRRAVAAGNDPTAALLLLRHFPGAETVKTLEAVAKKNSRSDNLGFSGFPMVVPALAANVSLSHLGSANADNALLSKIKSGDVNELIFLLKAVGFINNKKVLTALFQKTITDTTAIQPVTDRGALRYRVMLARMKDLAVYVFTEKLKLESDIKIEKNRRYKNSEINDAKQKINAALAQS